ncbi:hypothetical protein E2C01_043014 [Portunus trituberculatus]|uniref:Uncharacterized protein n=1 Tax=Portunus trituberculatus TaxID=210409 RepID=A0A5B7FWC7_PORTR|nr:hypothetical protein [Portunus trituberculatus]
MNMETYPGPELSANVEFQNHCTFPRKHIVKDSRVHQGEVTPDELVESYSRVNEKRGKMREMTVNGLIDARFLMCVEEKVNVEKVLAVCGGKS